MEVLAALAHAIGWTVLGGAIMLSLVILIGVVILACQRDLW